MKLLDRPWWHSLKGHEIIGRNDDGIFYYDREPGYAKYGFYCAGCKIWWDSPDKPDKRSMDIDRNRRGTIKYRPGRGLGDK